MPLNRLERCLAYHSGNGNRCVTGSRLTIRIIATNSAAMRRRQSAPGGPEERGKTLTYAASVHSSPKLQGYSQYRSVLVEEAINRRG